MRKLETREDIEKKEGRNKRIIGIVMAVILLFSTAAYAFSSFFGSNENNTNKVKYNGLEFTWQGSLWTTEINGNNFYFSYLPNETGSISTTKSINDYSGKTLYFTENSLARQEIERNIGSFLARNPQLACLEGSNCTGNLPVKNCSSNIIIIKEEYIIGSPIREEENCVFISSNDSLRDADSFLYRILGIK